MTQEERNALQARADAIDKHGPFPATHMVVSKAVIRELLAEHWIACALRMPEKEGRYVVVYLQGGRRPTLFTGDFRPTHGFSCQHLGPITHWMQVSLPARAVAEKSLMLKPC